MSKGTRKRETAAARREEEQRLLEQKRQNSRKRRRILIPVAVLAAVALAAGCVLYFVHRRQNDPDYQLHRLTAASSDSYRVSGGMMTYFISSSARNFARQNEDNLEALGLDLTLPLRSQPCYFDRDTSWFDYFAGGAVSSVKWMLSFAEQAKKEGVTLTQEEEDAIQTTLDRADLTQFGAYVNGEDLRACMELYYLAARQEEKTHKSITATDQQIRAWAQDNEKQLQLASYAHYTIAYGEKSPYEDKETGEALAAKLMNAASVEEFAALVEGEFVAREMYTPETIAENRGIYRVRGHAYAEGEKLDEWLFGGGVKVGDTFRTDAEGEITVYQCLEAPVRSTAPAVDVRHILITPGTAGSDAAASDRADKVLAEWQAGEATEESFGLLAAAYSEDGNASDGGLYTAVTEGVMVDTFNDWCFAEDRKPGDTGIVKTAYGYHVMYFVGAGEEWYMAAREHCLDDQYDALLAQYAETYHVQTFEDAVAGLMM